MEFFRNYAPERETHFLNHLAAKRTDVYARDFVSASTCQSFLRSIGHRQVFETRHPIDGPHTPKLIPHTTDNRFTHTQVATLIGDRLANESGLNRELVVGGMRIHDCGQPPTGHSGERFLSQKSGREYRHEYGALVILNQIENLGLSEEMQQCVAFHNFSSGVMERSDIPEEAKVVAICDKTSYTVCDAYETVEILSTRGQNRLQFNSKRSKELIDEIETMLQSINPNYRKILSQIDGNQPYVHELDNVFTLIENCLLSEWKSAGRVVIGNSEITRNLLRLRKYLTSNIYPFAENEETEFTVMEDAFSYLQKEFSNCNPYVLFCLLSESEMRRAAIVYKNPEDNDAYDLYLDILNNVVYCFGLDKPENNIADLFEVPSFIKSVEL